MHHFPPKPSACCFSPPVITCPFSYVRDQRWDDSDSGIGIGIGIGTFSRWAESESEWKLQFNAGIGIGIGIKLQSAESESELESNVPESSHLWSGLVHLCTDYEGLTDRVLLRLDQ